jgi:predicted metalloprotease with PDZ domain
MAPHYEVRVPDPLTHRFHVRFTCGDVPPGPWRVALPVWTPGSYLVREFARQVDDLAAADEDGASLPVHKPDKATWEVAVARRGSVTVTYTVYAHELSVRTNFLDADRGLLNGTGVFVYTPEARDQPGTLRIHLPDGWTAHTSLAEQEPGLYTFADYDDLVDSPVAMGTAATRDFTVGGVPHRLVVDGPGPVDPDQLADQIQKLVPHAAAVFERPLPYPRYTFILYQTDQTGGGLEHKNSSVMMTRRFGAAARGADAGSNLIRLVAHEHFHAWNVKRLHPDVLGPFDYSREAYTENLWLMEGGTDYYADLLPVRAGIATAQQLVESLGRVLDDDRHRAGRFHQSVAEASRDAWIKHYRPDEHSPDATVSYYARGKLASFLLDLSLRSATRGTETLDRFLARLWDRHPDGFGEDAPERLAVEMGGPALADFFREVVHGRSDLDLGVLSTIGLGFQEQPVDADAPPFTGLSTAVREGRLWVTRVEAETPAEAAGLSPGDELLAFDRLRLDPGRFAEQTRMWKPGTRIRVHVFSDGVLKEAVLELAAPRPSGRLVPAASAGAQERGAFEQWCGQPWPFS